MPSEKDLVLARRKAFAEGAFAAGGFPWYDAAAEAVKRYPLPKITQERHMTVVGRDGYGLVRWVGNDASGHAEIREGGKGWEKLPRPLETYPAKFIAGVADLKENPTEEVEDDTP